MTYGIVSTGRIDTFAASGGGGEDLIQGTGVMIEYLVAVHRIF